MSLIDIEKLSMYTDKRNTEMWGKQKLKNFWIGLEKTSNIESQKRVKEKDNAPMWDKI